MSDTPSTWSSWLPRILPALTFVVGVAIGAVFVGIGMSGGDDSEGAPDITPSQSATSPSGDASDTTVVVPAACSEAAGEVGAAVALLREGAGYVRDFQPGELVDVIDQLEDTDAELRDLAEQCSQVDVSPASGSASASPAE